MAKGVRTSWWAARTAREKRLLLVMSALLVLVLAWLAVIRPLMDARAAADARLTAAAAELAQARGDAAALKQRTAAAAGSPVPLPLDAFLTQAGGEQGFTGLTVVGDGPTQATISMPQVRPSAFFAWIGQLEGSGLVVESLSARANQDQTISVQAVLRAGGR